MIFFFHFSILKHVFFVDNNIIIVTSESASSSRIWRLLRLTGMSNKSRIRYESSFKKFAFNNLKSWFAFFSPFVFCFFHISVEKTLQINIPFKKHYILTIFLKNSTTFFALVVFYLLILDFSHFFFRQAKWNRRAAPIKQYFCHHQMVTSLAFDYWMAIYLC